MVSPDQNLYDRPDGSKQLTTRIVAFFSQVFPFSQTQIFVENRNIEKFLFLFCKVFSFSDFPFDSQKFRVILEAEVGVQYYLYENEEHSHIPRSSQLTTHVCTKEKDFFLFVEKEIEKKKKKLERMITLLLFRNGFQCIT